MTLILLGGVVQAAEYSNKPVNLLLDGDSIAAGQGAARNLSLGQQIFLMLPSRAKLTVHASSGSPISERLSLFSSNVSTVRPSSDEAPVLLFHGGDNDIRLGADAVTTYRRLKDYVHQAHLAGWQVIVSTELDRFDFSPAAREELARFNSLMRADSAGADGLADFAANRTLASREARRNTDLFNEDGIHPTSAGYWILADIAVKAITSVIRSN